jgi:hypothetical protein
MPLLRYESAKALSDLGSSIGCNDSKRLNVAWHDSKEASKLKQLTRLSTVELKFCFSLVQKPYPW